jgi:hypothetical protein
LSERDTDRALDARIKLLEDAGIARLLDAQRQDAASGIIWSADQVKEFVEALLAEKDRALAMADDEREKAASALRGEQRRALDQAASEREKAAENLRVELARSIREGDERLREHIQNQVMQIGAALVSADKLELERMGKVQATVEALVDKLEVLRAAQSTAQDKFEHSVESRFKQVNEFRAALDDLGKQMATRREMEAASAAIAERAETLQKSLADLRSRIDVGPEGLDSLRARADAAAGKEEGVKLTTGLLFGSIAALAAVITIVIILANYATGK